MKSRFAIARKYRLAALGIVLLAGFALLLSRSGPLAPTRVTVTRVVENDLTPTLFGIGTLEARRSYQIGPTAAGRVQRVAVDVGETVKAGQLLAEMDPIDLDQRANASAAAAARARSAIATAAAQLRDAQSRRELAAITRKRYLELGDKAFVTRSVVDGKLQEEKSAEAQVEAAEAALLGARQEYERLRAESDGLRQQREKIRLIAPLAGLVTARDAEPGSTLIAGQSAIRMLDPDSLWIRLRLDQGRSSGLRTGLPARITLRSQPGSALPGKVVRVEPIADSITEERIAQIAFDTLPGMISIGEMAEVTLQLPTIENARLIPNAAIRHQGGNVGVWRKNAGGDLSFVPVKLAAASADGRTQVLDGLAPGDEIIVHGERELHAGSRIRVVSSLTENGQ